MSLLTGRGLSRIFLATLVRSHQQKVLSLAVILGTNSNRLFVLNPLSQAPRGVIGTVLGKSADDAIAMNKDRILGGIVILDLSR